MLDPKNFDSILHGKKIGYYFLENSAGLKGELTNYGARMVSMLVPDRNGVLVDVNVGFDHIDDYINAEDQCYGAVIGRYAGRIAAGKFSIDDNHYQLEVNNGNNAIHGGHHGFQTKVWDGVQVTNGTVEFSYVSMDGEEGYPGEMQVKVTYRLTDANELIIDFEYSSDKKTVANIINHNFWNLNGEYSGTVHDHSLKIFTDQFLAINKDCIPVKPIAGHNTAFDFTDFRKIGEWIDDDDEQIKNGSGYDHSFVFEKSVSAQPKLMAIAIGDRSGIQMEIHSTEPAIHFYTGNFMNCFDPAKTGLSDHARTAFCLETQHYPDSPNNPDAPSTLIEPGKIYTSTTIHKFLTSPN